MTSKEESKPAFVVKNLCYGNKINPPIPEVMTASEICNLTFLGPGIATKDKTCCFC